MCFLRLFTTLIAVVCFISDPVSAQVKEQLLYIDSDMEGIRERMVGTAFVDDVWVIDNKLTLLKYNSTKAIYSFNNEILYQVDLLDKFDRKSEAEKQYTLYIDYVRQIGAIPLGFNTEGDRRMMAAEKGDQIFMVTMEPNDADGTTAVSLSLHYAERAVQAESEALLSRLAR